VAKVVEALEEAVIACHRDPLIAEEVGARLFPTLERSVVKRAVMRMLSEGTFPAHVEVSPAAWQAALRSRLQVGDLQKPQATEVSVDNSFAKAAAKPKG
jgi:ABC-type nitrate/sulfonate/bicarbonate transport system substrate-binding protein